MRNATRPLVIDPAGSTDLADDDTRRVYEACLVRAMGFAERYLSRDQALEIAHDIAIGMLRIAPDRITGTLIYAAVTNRVRRYWRSTNRRAAIEGAYHERWSSTMPSWVEPAAEMEIREMQARIASVVAAMPEGMRAVFQLIREEGLTYKDAAARLGVGVGTVHTQLSRATALLRDCITEYQSGPPRHDALTKGRQP